MSLLLHRACAQIAPLVLQSWTRGPHRGLWVAEGVHSRPTRRSPRGPKAQAAVSQSMGVPSAASPLSHQTRAGRTARTGSWNSSPFCVPPSPKPLLPTDPRTPRSTRPGAGETSASHSLTSLWNWPCPCSMYQVYPGCGTEAQFSFPLKNLIR